MRHVRTLSRTRTHNTHTCTHAHTHTHTYTSTHAGAHTSHENSGKRMKGVGCLNSLRTHAHRTYKAYNAHTFHKKSRDRKKMVGCLNSSELTHVLIAHKTHNAHKDKCKIHVHTLSHTLISLHSRTPLETSYSHQQPTVQ
jgi:hypothetical protein